MHSQYTLSRTKKHLKGYVTIVDGTQELGKFMKNLKNNLFSILLFCFFVSACQSANKFNLKTFGNDLHVIRVNSNHVRQKCLFYNTEGDNNWRHLYLMFVLNDKNEVLEIMQPTDQDKNSCYSQLHKIEKILEQESQVRICVRSELKRTDKNSEKENKTVQFGVLGAHDIAYESLTLDSICNSKTCMSNNYIFANTCPGFPKRESAD